MSEHEEKVEKILKLYESLNLSGHNLRSVIDECKRNGFSEDRIKTILIPYFRDLKNEFI